MRTTHFAVADVFPVKQQNTPQAAPTVLIQVSLGALCEHPKKGHGQSRNKMIRVHITAWFWECESDAHMMRKHNTNLAPSFLVHALSAKRMLHFEHAAY